MELQESIQKWTKALSNSERYFKRAMIESREEILDLNTAQLEQGKDSKGNFLAAYALDTYAQFKQSLNSAPPFGIPDLKLEGDFHEGFVLIDEGNEFRISSTDAKTGELVQGYGEDIFGLTEESLNEIRPALLQIWIELFKNDTP